MSKNGTFLSGVAGRYGTALFDLASDQAAVDRVSADFENLKKLLAESSDLNTLVNNPVFSRDEQSAGILAVAEKAGFDPLTVKFLGLVARNRRLFCLADIISGFAALVAHDRGEVSAEVVSARPLNDGQLDDVRKALAKAVGSEVNLNTSVDESLIGGLVVKVGSRMIDNSLRTKIQNLKVAMKGVG